MPSDTNLITSMSVTNVDGLVAALRARLQEHTLQRYYEVHGLWGDVRIENVFSRGANGHPVTRYARRLIAVQVGGVMVDIPADPVITGPPLEPVITLQPTGATSSAEDRHSQPNVSFRCSATGVQNLHFNWQQRHYVIIPRSQPDAYRWDGTWTDLQVGISMKLSNDGTTIVQAMTAYAPLQITSLLTIHWTKSGDTGNTATASKFRCIVSSDDGGEVISNEANLRTENDT